MYVICRFCTLGDGPPEQMTASTKQGTSAAKDSRSSKLVKIHKVSHTHTYMEWTHNA
uniref:Uncharacterized protein n=1 Tax=Anguilla anguilla TaxID=7936 RepID=A0A0E9PLM0_ANGAN